jgi:hypothetical protein
MPASHVAREDAVMRGEQCDEHDVGRDGTERDRVHVTDGSPPHEEIAAGADAERRDEQRAAGPHKQSS